MKPVDVTKLKPGDLVMLRSGGPPMSVDHIAKECYRGPSGTLKPVEEWTVIVVFFAARTGGTTPPIGFDAAFHREQMSPRNLVMWDPVVAAGTYVPGQSN